MGEGLRAQQPHQQPLLPDNEPSEQKQEDTNLNQRSNLVPGYTTLDDLGCDGDDTIHSPITFYEVPNCIQAIFPSSLSNIVSDYSSSLNPATKSSSSHNPSAPPSPANPSTTDAEPVDLLFNAFLQPFILHLLNFLPWLPSPSDSNSDAIVLPSCVIAGVCEDLPPADGVRHSEESTRLDKERPGLKIDIDEEETEMFEVAMKKKYTIDDVENYVPGETFTSVFAGWIKENWAKNCPEKTDFV
ncbi:hypothetical protein H2198_006952 [Neophaeococcomyces mojaviensis]|uniref:Uncharacterized protein n=1 Tax=Neophaeococcomyces mojaviensis TaxID=3383035 RepID=A0ACC3A289_9EURO|nr:hypothetical protein H2198_006952 [Knufia sp. JES_112]